MGRAASADVARAKATVVQGIREGRSLADCLKAVGRSMATYYEWRRRDPDFKARVELVRSVQGPGVSAEERQRRAVGFAEFRRKYLGMGTFPHQQQWIDLVEGRPLKDLHPAIKYEQGRQNHILVNCPPEHSKTMTLSIDYVTYRICLNPNVKVIIASKTQDMAKQILYAIKARLTHPRYSDLQRDFAPPDGFDGKNSVWQSAMVYLGSEARDTTEKDPNLRAIGIGQQIYGGRADLMLVDDAITLNNCAAWESHVRWIQQEVITRIGPGGKLVVAGTRVDSVDLYRELRNPDRYPDGKSPWTYLAQPAVLEYADDRDDWVTLWPKSDVPWTGLDDDDPRMVPDQAGLYPRWDGRHLFERRGVLDPKTWSLVYMQADVSDTSVFNAKAVRACVNGGRTVGVMRKEIRYHREQGMDGLYVVCAMDPAMVGDTATLVYAVDTQTHKRYVLDANRMPNPSPQQIKTLIRAWTEKYSPNAWVIEKNAFQLYLTRDEEIRTYLANRGVQMVEHYTGQNKIDPDFGVASVAPLFEEKMIELPSTHNSEGMKALVEQLITWQPGVKGKDLKMDLPMALWFAELKARLVIDQYTMGYASHRSSRYLPKYRARKQVSLYLDDLQVDAE